MLRVIAAGLLCLAPIAALAQDAGAIPGTVNIYAAGTAGGGVDLFGRLLGRHIGRHIAGAPNVVVQVMPGAGGIRAANFLAQQAPRDGTAMAIFAGGPILEPLIGDRNPGYDMSQFTWIGAISKEMTDLAGRAKEGKLKPEEYQGGTASLSNMGMFGIKQFEAVINPPQGMIMAIGAGEKRPYVIDDSLQIATSMSASGSFDHRAIDGADGAKLMKGFKALVENPLGLVA